MSKNTITDGYARVLRHRFKKKNNLSVNTFRLLCESGHITKLEAKEISDKEVGLLKDKILEFKEIIKNFDKNIK